MNIFLDHIFLYFGLGAFLVLIGTYIVSQKTKKRRLEKLTSEKLISKLVPSWSSKQQIFKFGFYMLALTFLFLGFARPQWGSEKRKSNSTGIDILIALDVSKSMLARDVRPNRLERVKLSISNQLEKVAGDRLGLIAFSGSAFLYCPLTLDHQAFSKTLNNLEIGIIKNQGTDLAQPIEEALYSFSKIDTDRFLVLISDGEDLEGEGLKKAKEAAKKGIKIYTIGIGDKNGARIPMDPLGQSPRNFLRDPQGNTVVTKLDEDSLRSIAHATGGKYFSLGPTGEGLAKVLQILQRIGQQKKRAQISTELPIDRYQFFLVIGFFILCAEMLTDKKKKKISHNVTLLITVIMLATPGCFKQDNVKRAEKALESGNPSLAGDFFEAEINSTISLEKTVDPRLFLNAGLAYLDAENLVKAEAYLNNAIKENLSDPLLQAKALNGLGNIFYQHANQFLDRRDVRKARNAWEKAREFYKSSMLIDGNENAQKNLTSLDTQIQNRINALISKINGKMWRDLNGDGKPQINEPGLKGFIFWDKDQNGEHNQSTEPFVPSNADGLFSFEWISDNYPTYLRLGTILKDSNKSRIAYLVPIFPPPPPPENSLKVKNFYLDLNKAVERTIGIPFRAAPTLQGTIWKDSNGNGIQEPDDVGYKGGRLFLDENANFQLDQNETSFEPAEDGTFIYPVMPGQYSLCIQPQNPDANITFPIEIKKAYLAWTDFDSPSLNLDFGIQDNPNQDNNSSGSQNQPNPTPQNESADPSNSSKPEPDEVNALYERLLQEMESVSEPLEQKLQPKTIQGLGRDY